MRYKNTSYKKIRSSHIMLISCGYCKEELIRYQKVGKGGLINLYTDRVIESEVDLSSDSRELVCPVCKHKLGNRLVLKSGEEVYKMIRSSFNTRREKKSG